MRRTKKWLAIIMAAAVVASGAGATQLGTVAAYAAANAVVVTTADGSADYSTSDAEKAFVDTITTYPTDDATITLNEDVTLDTSKTYTVTKPLTIVLNGHKITNADRLAAGTDICQSPNTVTDKIVFAKHNPQYVANWEENTAATTDAGKWVVKEVTVTCENCGSDKYAATGSVTYDASTGTYTYTDANTTSTHKVNTETSGYRLSGNVTFATVNGKIQHDSKGLPIVKATVVNNTTEAKADPAITIAAATKKELEGATVYEKDGTTVTAKRNVDATCTKEGAVVYKVVVADPDGKNLKEIYMLDDQASSTIGHTQGALKGYKLLTKEATEYDSEAAARSAAKTAGKTVAKVTSVKNKYYYWFWAASDVATVSGSSADTMVSSINATTPIDVSAAVEEDGSFTYMPVYFCDYEGAAGSVDGDAVTVTPLADAATAAEAADGKHSACESWNYAAISVTYAVSNPPGAAAKSTYTWKSTVSSVTKPKAAFSHVSDGTKYDVTKQPTCAEKGDADVHCAICDKDVSIPVETLADNFVAFEGSTPAANVIDKNASSDQVVTLNADKTEATIEATCTKDGGVYKYCDGKNNGSAGHWVKQSTTKATGHDLATIVAPGTWSDGSIAGTGDVDADYNKNLDYVYTVKQQCKNPGCVYGATVAYHSQDKSKAVNVSADQDVYNGVEVVDQSKGADCETYAKTVYTVKGITLTTGATITKEFTKTGAAYLGDHKYNVTTWNWSEDYKNATVTVKCIADNCKAAPKNPTDSKSAKVTQSTAANGLTTFTATYAGQTESKEAYSLKDAKVTYDTKAITDGNLVKGLDGAAPQVPDVTVTINGTVIDSSNYVTTWTYNAATKEVKATVDWSAEVKASDAERVAASAESDTFKVGAKKQIAAATITTVAKENGEDLATTTYTRGYDPTLSNSVVTTTTTKGASVKYAISDKEVKATASELNKDKWATQKKIEALDFDEDSVEDIDDVGKYYVYAQITADGYTSFTTKVADIVITKKRARVYVDNATVVEGDTPNLHIRAVDNDNKSDTFNDELNIDPEDFTITTVGGESIENLKAGTYRLRVTADNYQIETAETSYVATLTVLAKDDSTVEEQAKAESVVAAINSLNDSSSADDIAAARAAYNALSDTAKARVDADVLKKLTALEQKNTAAADKAAAQAVIDQLSKLTSSSSAADAQKAVDAYNALTAAQKAIVDANSTAKANLTKAQETAKSGKTTLKKAKITTVKLAKKTFKASALKKKKATTKIKVTKKTGNGKITYKKTSGNKKITVSKAGKVTLKKGLKKGTYKVKVKVTMAKTSKYKKATKTVTLKIKVK